MSFMETRSAIAICNHALDRISQQGISGSLTNPVTNVARICARKYPMVVRTLLEQHHFGLASKRATLVEVANTRTGEWSGAYAPPPDMAFPVGFSGYSAGPVNFYRALGALIGTMSGRPVFRYEGGVIYSNLGTADLDYVSLDITEQDFNQTFENLVIVFLAAELAHPIAKDRQLGKDLYEEGMSKLNWAIAQSLNLQHQTYGSAPTETEMARGGGVGDFLGVLGGTY